MKGGALKFHTLPIKTLYSPDHNLQDVTVTIWQIQCKVILVVCDFFSYFISTKQYLGWDPYKFRTLPTVTFTHPINKLCTLTGSDHTMILNLPFIYHLVLQCKKKSCHSRLVLSDKTDSPFSLPVYSILWSSNILNLIANRRYLAANNSWHPFWLSIKYH